MPVPVPYTKTTGTGPLYQGRYKSFVIENDKHLLTVIKYVERNPVRAKLAKRCEEWRWGSAWIRTHGNAAQKSILAVSPVPLPRNYSAWIHEAENAEVLDGIRRSVVRGAPFGSTSWKEEMISTYGLISTVRAEGRPKKKKK